MNGDLGAVTTENVSQRSDGGFATVGIDLASQPQNTAVCVINWSQESAIVSALASGSFGGRELDDATLLSIMENADKVAVDAPFGWPEPFIRAISSEPGRWHADESTRAAVGAAIRTRIGTAADALRTN